MTRQLIEQSGYTRTGLDFDPEQHDLKAWLMTHAERESWILAHADDGLMWGRATAQGVLMSGELNSVISPPLRVATLQRLHLFNETYEVTLWQQNGQWQSIKIAEDGSKATGAIDEQHLLWGTYGEQDPESGFSLLEDGTQGLKHILPPLQANNASLAGELGTLDERRIKRAYVLARHYLQEDEIGVNRIAVTRYVELGVRTYE